MVDFHSHVLPGIDDGSASVEMSMAMLKEEAAQGVRTVIATPHFYADVDTPAQFLAKRQAAAETLREAMKDQVGLPEVIPGAEVAFFRGMSDSEALWDLCIGDTNYILVELPMPPWNARVYEELKGLVSKQNLRPVLAHIDRYLLPFGWQRTVDRLLELPVLLQVNAGFFLHKRSKTALRLLREESIHLLGSDCHNLDSRPPNLRGAVEAIRRKLGGDAIAQIQYYQQQVLSEERSNHCTIGANI